MLAELLVEGDGHVDPRAFLSGRRRTANASSAPRLRFRAGATKVEAAQLLVSKMRSERDDSADAASRSDDDLGELVVAADLGYNHDDAETP
jgi:hypothetical protein